MNSVGILWAVGFFVVCMWGGLFSYIEGTFSWRQMLDRHHVARSIPWNAHLAMWGDLLVISPLMGYIIGTYHAQWSNYNIWRAGTAGITLGLIAQLWYAKSPAFEAHVMHHRVTLSGWMHALFMGAVITVVLLFYSSATSGRSVHDLVLMGSGLWLVIFLGSHPLRLLKLPWYQNGPWLDRVNVATMIVSAAAFAILGVCLRP